MKINRFIAPLVLCSLFATNSVLCSAAKKQKRVQAAKRETRKVVNDLKKEFGKKSLVLYSINPIERLKVDFILNKEVIQKKLNRLKKGKYKNLNIADAKKKLFAHQEKFYKDRVSSQEKKLNKLRNKIDQMVKKITTDVTKKNITKSKAESYRDNIEEDLRELQLLAGDLKINSLIDEFKIKGEKLENMAIDFGNALTILNDKIDELSEKEMEEEPEPEEEEEEGKDDDLM